LFTTGFLFLHELHTFYTGEVIEYRYMFRGKGFAQANLYQKTGISVAEILTHIGF